MSARQIFRPAVALAALSVAAAVYAQQAPAPIYADPNAPAPQGQPLAGQAVAGQAVAGPPDAAPAVKLPAGEIEQLVAPVALYPDALLSQVLMASTYPLEIVQARRFVESSPALAGDALAQQLDQQPWDPSVKSLVNFPTVLQLLDEKLDWTVKLGDAFLAQQPDVMDAVQRLRGQAQAAGNLQGSLQQKVTVAPAPPVVVDDSAYAQPPLTQYVTIENTSPDTYYVPVYDPGTVYGTWAYPAYRPFFWHPREYVPTRGFWYGPPCPLGPSWGYAFGLPDWRRRQIDLDLRRNERFDRRLAEDRGLDRLRERAARHDTAVYAAGRTDQRAQDAANDRTAARALEWRHESEHRLGVGYRDPVTARRYNGRTADAGTTAGTTARTADRGRDARPDTQVGRNNVTPGNPTLGTARPADTAAKPNAAAVGPNQRPGTDRTGNGDHDDAKRDNAGRDNAGRDAAARDNGRDARADRPDADRAAAARQQADRDQADRVAAARRDAVPARPQNDRAAPANGDPKTARPDNARPDNAGRTGGTPSKTDTPPRPAPAADRTPPTTPADRNAGRTPDRPAARATPDNAGDGNASKGDRANGNRANGNGSNANGSNANGSNGDRATPARSAPAPAPAPVKSAPTPAPAPPAPSAPARSAPPAPSPAPSAPAPARADPPPAAPSGGGRDGGNGNGSGSGAASGGHDGGRGR